MQPTRARFSTLLFAAFATPILALAAVLATAACRPAPAGPATATPTLIPTLTSIPATGDPSQGSGVAATSGPTQSIDQTSEPPTPTPAPFDIAALPAGAWTRLENMPTSRSEMAAVVLEGLIYVPGGFGNAQEEFAARALEVYDPVANTWTKRAPLPGGRHHAMAAGLDGRLYVFGGSCIPACPPGSDTTFVYDPAADSWTELARMPERRVAGAAVALDGFLYVIGGTGGNRDLLRYDPAADAWTRLAPLIEAREHTAAVAVNGEIYALGGRWLVEMNSVEIYDPAADEWRQARPMFAPRAGHGAAVLDGMIYVLGGEVFLTTQSPVTLDSVEVFNPTGGVWTTVDPLPAPLHGLPAAAFEGLLYALGGSGRAADIANQGRVYVWKP